jgi:hypothetical protein
MLYTEISFKLLVDYVSIRINASVDDRRMYRLLSIKLSREIIGSYLKKRKIDIIIVIAPTFIKDYV